MIVIPMVGESSRFLRAGYKQPKFMLELHGRPVFDYALGSFRRFFGREQFLMVIRETGGIRNFVETRLSSLGVANAQIVILGDKTAGQASTVALGVMASGLPTNAPLTIFNIDTFRPNYEVTPEDAAADAFLETFHGPGDGWSFVVPAASASPHGGVVERVIEKQRVSDECSNGLYRFASADLFLASYHRERTYPSQTLAEHYVAPVLNQVIMTGGTVRFRHLPPEATFFCGVPDEYEKLKSLRRLPSTLIKSVAPDLDHNSD